MRYDTIRNDTIRPRYDAIRYDTLQYDLIRYDMRWKIHRCNNDTVDEVIRRHRYLLSEDGDLARQEEDERLDLGDVISICAQDTRHLHLTDLSQLICSRKQLSVHIHTKVDVGSIHISSEERYTRVFPSAPREDKQGHFHFHREKIYTGISISPEKWLDKSSHYRLGLGRRDTRRFPVGRWPSKILYQYQWVGPFDENAESCGPVRLHFPGQSGKPVRPWAITYYKMC